jgi:hypothetical protein
MKGGYPYVQQNAWTKGQGNDRVISSRIEPTEMASIHFSKMLD